VCEWKLPDEGKVGPALAERVREDGGLYLVAHGYADESAAY
jgi:hypothetical protein